MTISFGATEFGWWRNDREAINKDQSRHLDWAKIPRICMAYNTITALIAGTGSSAGSALCDLPVRAAPQWRTRSDYRGKASTSVAGFAGGCLDGAAELLGGAAGGALSAAVVSAELLSAGDTPVAAGLFAGAAGRLLATGDVRTDLLATGAGPVALACSSSLPSDCQPLEMLNCRSLPAHLLRPGYSPSLRPEA
jgi:hypothetical protein